MNQCLIAKFCVIFRSLGCSFVRSFPPFLPKILTHPKLWKFTNQMHIRLRWCVNYQNIGHFQPTRERPKQGRALISYHKNTSCILPILSIHVKSGVTLHNDLSFFSFCEALSAFVQTHYANPKVLCLRLTHPVCHSVFHGRVSNNVIKALGHYSLHSIM